MTDTPRTDAAAYIAEIASEPYDVCVVGVEFARTLEREQADLREAIRKVVNAHEGHVTVGWIKTQLLTALRQAGSEQPSQREAPGGDSAKLWLWRNFVDGKPEYWAFDNPWPMYMDSHDPQTLGEPCGYALVKPSRNAHPERTEEEALRGVQRALATEKTVQDLYVAHCAYCAWDGGEFPSLFAAKLAAQAHRPTCPRQEPSGEGFGWIAVGERMPEKDVPVLAFWRPAVPGNSVDFRCYAIAMFTNEGWVNAEDGSVYSDASCWAPLPHVLAPSGGASAANTNQGEKT